MDVPGPQAPSTSEVFMHRFDSLWTRDVDAVMGQNARTFLRCGFLQSCVKP